MPFSTRLSSVCDKDARLYTIIVSRDIIIIAGLLDRSVGAGGVGFRSFRIPRCPWIAYTTRRVTGYIDKLAHDKICTVEFTNPCRQDVTGDGFTGKKNSGVRAESVSSPCTGKNAVLAGARTAAPPSPNGFARRSAYSTEKQTANSVAKRAEFRTTATTVTAKRSLNSNATYRV